MSSHIFTRSLDGCYKHGRVRSHASHTYISSCYIFHTKFSHPFTKIVPFNCPYNAHTDCKYSLPYVLNIQIRLLQIFYLFTYTIRQCSSLTQSNHKRRQQQSNTTHCPFWWNPSFLGKSFLKRKNDVAIINFTSSLIHMGFWHGTGID